ncbi:MAG: stage III sporulation protein AA [Limnochordaceae bacterium]|nr:stage III sporulation protein AA [Limnochordaceae bacterium]
MAGDGAYVDPTPILEVLPTRLRSWAQRLSPGVWRQLEEIRLRVNQPVQLLTATREGFLGADGWLAHPEQVPLVMRAEVEQIVRLASQHSLYAHEEQIRQGFLTLPGGHRLGLAGRVVVEQGRVRSLQFISSVSIRLHRPVNGGAESVLPSLVAPHPPYVYSTLVISPPGCGKTTLLRGLTRALANGAACLSLPPRNVVVVDERSELAGSWQGVPQSDLGLRTDVLDGCPKAEGIVWALRALAPHVIVTDEIGRAEDVPALLEAERAGVAVIASAHGSSWQEVVSRPLLAPLRTSRYFRRAVLLSRRQGPGTVEQVFVPPSPPAPAAS